VADDTYDVCIRNEPALLPSIEQQAGGKNINLCTR